MINLEGARISIKKNGFLLTKILLCSFSVYFLYLMLLITLQYVPVNTNVAFLKIKTDAIKYPYYQLAFFSHVYSSMIILILGFLQFSIKKENFKKLHKNLGKIYIILVLLIASPSGLIMAIHANGGFSAKLSFVLQSVFWFYFTYKAYVLVKHKDWKGHSYFMIRSFALTLSAISLRLCKYFIVNIFELPPMDTYRIVAWLGWVLNLVFAEIYIYNLKKETRLQK